MSTKAIIGVVQRNKTVKSFTVFYDGYPTNILYQFKCLIFGPQLVPERIPVGVRPIDDVVRMGNLRTIGPTVNECDQLWRYAEEVSTVGQASLLHNSVEEFMDYVLQAPHGYQYVYVVKLNGEVGYQQICCFQNNVDP